MLQSVANLQMVLGSSYIFYSSLHSLISQHRSNVPLVGCAATKIRFARRLQLTIGDVRYVCALMRMPMSFFISLQYGKLEKLIWQITEVRCRTCHRKSLLDDIESLNYGAKWEP